MEQKSKAVLFVDNSAASQRVLEIFNHLADEVGIYEIRPEKCDFSLPALFEQGNIWTKERYILDWAHRARTEKNAGF